MTQSYTDLLGIQEKMEKQQKPINKKGKRVSLALVKEGNTAFRPNFLNNQEEEGEDEQSIALMEEQF